MIIQNPIVRNAVRNAVALNYAVEDWPGLKSKLLTLIRNLDRDPKFIDQSLVRINLEDGKRSGAFKWYEPKNTVAKLDEIVRKMARKAEREGVEEYLCGKVYRRLRKGDPLLSEFKRAVEAMKPTQDPSKVREGSRDARRLQEREHAASMRLLETMNPNWRD